MLPLIAIFLLAMGGIGGSFQPSRLAIAAAALFFKLSASTKKNVLGLTPLLKKGILIYAIWILYGLVTLVWAPDPYLGFTNELLVMALGMSSLVFFPFYFKKEKSSIKAICNSWAWSCIATLPIALYEIFTMNHFFYVDEDRVIGSLGIEAPFAAVFTGNYNGYSVMLCFYYPFLLASFFLEKQKVYKLIYLVSTLLTFFVVLINTSRGALLSIVIMSLSIFKFNIKKITIATALLILLYVILPSNIKDILTIVLDSRYSEGGGFNDNIRSNLALAGLDFLKQSYGLGIGAGAFEIEMLQSKYFTSIVNPHNILIEILSQYGIIIFILFIYWLGLIFKKIYANNSIQSKVKRILLASIICIPITGAINSAALGYTYWWLYFTSIAIIGSITFNKERSNSVVSSSS